MGVAFHNVPGCPEAPNVSHRTEHEATLTFKPPDDNGSAITGYIIEMRTQPDSPWKTTGPQITDLEFTATNLQPSLEYEFRVTAVNAAGKEGQPSPPSVPSKYGNLEFRAIITYDKAFNK